MDNPLLDRIWHHSLFYSLFGIFVPCGSEMHCGSISLRPNSNAVEYLQRSSKQPSLPMSRQAMPPFFLLASELV